MGDVVVKREATATTLTRFGEFTGGSLIQYNILNLADISATYLPHIPNMIYIYKYLILCLMVLTYFCK